MKKRIILILLAAVILIPAGYVLWVREIYPRISPIDEDDWPDANYLMDEVDGKYYFFGDKLAFPPKMEMEYISKIDTASLDMDHDWVYLIINDWKEEQNISEETAKELVEFADKNSNFSFVYIGNKAFGHFSKLIRGFQPVDEDLCFGYEMYEGDRIVSMGIFTTKDLQYVDKYEYIPADVIVMNMKSNISSNQ